MAVRLTTSAEATAVKKPDTTRDGVYTAEQAVAGEKTYYARCSMCHGDDLAGIERAPALAGSQFLDSWNGKDLRRLLDRVLTMPPGDPKPPTTAEAAEVLAFLLRTAEMPSGSTALPADRSRLAEITFERKP
jgi:mono/diheme cytochrome c family protein